MENSEFFRCAIEVLVMDEMVGFDPKEGDNG